MKRIDLCGQWSMKECTGTEITPVMIPGSVLSGLDEAGKLKDPFYRMNEYETSELFNQDYEFKRTFELTGEELEEEKIELVCDGLDTLTEVYVNESLLGTTDNMHRTYVFPAKEALQAGENTIRIVVKSVHKFIENRKPTPGKEIYNIQCGCKKGNEYLRKAHCMFGWDWGASIPDAGIWRKIGLRMYSDVRIDDVIITQKHSTQKVDLDIRVVGELLDGTEKEVKITVTAPDGTVLKKTGVIKDDMAEHADENCNASADITLTVENPMLWWPNGLGGQPLYTVLVECGNDQKELRIGLRTLGISQDKDQWGQEFCFMVNGVKFFSMGADYIPEDTIYKRITPERIRSLLDACVRANYNTIRVWGGGYYPSDTFYDYCDELGLVVWQDFMFACNVYDVTEDFAETVKHEVIDNAKRLRHHASLGLWCGNNEIESAWVGWDSFKGHSESLKEDYLKLFEEIIPNALRSVDTQTFYWPSSPSSFGGFDRPGDENYGDTHYWEVWHGLKPFTDYRKYYFRYCSEFGFQSFPLKKTVYSYTEESDRNIFSEVMESHQKNDAANGKMLYYLSENFLYPKNFESLLYVTQILQGLAIKAGVEHWRRNRGRCMGALYWQLNDSWPVASWASIDYYGRWKALHYMAAKFFAPVAGSLDRTEGSVTPVVQNESRQKHNVEVILRLRSLDFTILSEKKMQAEIAPLSVCRFEETDYTELIQDRKQQVFVEAVFTDDTGRTTTETEIFVPYKHMQLMDPSISVRMEEEEDAYVYYLKASSFAPFVELELTEADGIFEDNYFALTNGEEKKVRLKKSDLAGENPAVCVHSLRDTY